MKFSLGKTKRDFIYYSVIGVLIVFGIIFSLLKFPETAAAYLLLGALLFPKITIGKKTSMFIDIPLIILSTAFTIYFDHLITMYDHDFFAGYHSIVKYLFFINKDKMRYLFEVFIVIAAYCLLRAFFVPSKICAFLSSGGPLFICLLNYFIYAFRGAEMIPYDIYGFETAMNVVCNYRMPFFVPFAFLVLPYLLFATAMIRLDVAKTKLPVKIATSVLCVFIVFGSLYALKVSLKKIFVDHNVCVWYDEATRYNGYITNFTMLIKTMRAVAPGGYNAEEMRSLQADTYFDTTDTANIIVILNESYTDMAVYGDRFGDLSDVAPFWNSLSENAVKGTAYVSVYGGRTPNSEFEFLTSLTTAYLPGGSIPFVMYIDSDTYSLAHYLNINGYHTTAMHPYLQSGWSRTTVYPYLGFDDMMFIEDMEYDDEDLIRDFLSDRYAYETMIDDIQSHEGQKTFSYLMTMQNHGGYDMEFDNFTPTEYVDPNTEYGSEMNMFLSLIHESDEALEYLIDYLSQQDEKYVLLVVGDHQPNIDFPADGDLGGEKWTVPYLLWTNYDMPVTLTNREDTTTSLTYLALDLVEAAGIELSPYYAFISQMRDVMPVTSFSGYRGTDGQWYGFDDYRGAGEAINRYFSLRYSLLFDN